MAAAQIVMEHWAACYRKILEDSGVKIHLLAGYVDDGRQITSLLPLGMRYDDQIKKFCFSKEAEIEDSERRAKGEADNQRMARICISAMNSINEDLKFTTESQEDYPLERLPTLDFEMWASQDNLIRHSYFQKPMKTPFVLMERSGTSRQQKFQILTNELTRRLSNIQLGEISQIEINEKVEQFIQELKNSGYNQKQAKEIVNCGIRGWKNKIRKRKRNNIPFYRLAETTVKERLEKQLTERETWYKQTPVDDDDDEDSPRKRMRTTAPLKKDLETSLTCRRGKGRKYQKNTGRKDIKSVIFVPHTKDSGLAKILREKEEKIVEVTGDRVKVVEKAGRKLEDMIAGKDPWKGADCGRKNCLICSTKTLTGKNLKADCTKRNILYEIHCLTCENRELERIREICDEDEERKKDMIRNMKTPKYIGETSRSGYERGYEHLNNLASLNSQSHMLRHMVMSHEDEDFGEVQWGMTIISFKRSAFERQLDEAVTIAREASKGEILNSKSEYNQCVLPRLVTRIGDTEKEFKEWEKQLKDEKEKEDEVESRIRKLRKQKNKARLVTETNKPTNKRQKIDDTNYISIRDTWGPPITSAPRKNKPENDIDIETEKETASKKHRIEKETSHTIFLTNNRRIEDKVIEGETITDFVIEEIDWDKHLKEHRERLELEASQREKRLEKKSMKQKSWELYIECKNFLEQNEKNWEKTKLEREQERRKMERLSKANKQQEELRTRVKERKLEKERAQKLEELPTLKRNELLLEEEREKRKEIIETKKNLWKLRNKEKKMEISQENAQKLDKISDLEKKISAIDNILENLREEKKKHKLETEERKEKMKTEWRKKVQEKYKKENERKEQLEKQTIGKKHWEMLRWVTGYIKDNQDQWETERLEKQKNYEKELEDWDKLRRLEKVKKLKERWRKTSSTIEKKEPETPTKLNPAPISHLTTVWRKKINTETDLSGFDIPSENLKNRDQEPITIHYDTTNLMKPAKLMMLQKNEELEAQPSMSEEKHRCEVVEGLRSLNEDEVKVQPSQSKEQPSNSGGKHRCEVQPTLSEEKHRCEVVEGLLNPTEVVQDQNIQPSQKEEHDRCEEVGDSRSLIDGFDTTSKNHDQVSDENCYEITNLIKPAKLKLEQQQAVENMIPGPSCPSQQKAVETSRPTTGLQRNNNKDKIMKLRAPTRKDNPKIKKNSEKKTTKSITDNKITTKKITEHFKTITKTTEGEKVITDNSYSSNVNGRLESQLGTKLLPKNSDVQLSNNSFPNFNNYPDLEVTKNQKTFASTRALVTNLIPNDQKDPG